MLLKKTVFILGTKYETDKWDLEKNATITELQNKTSVLVV